MYSLLRRVPKRSVLTRQLPTAGGSLLVAELFYKFGSFSLEALAFLATWFVVDLAYHTARDALDATPAES